MVSGSKVEYVQTGQLVVADYVKNTKAIGFLWGVFSVCYALISLLVFFQPQWIGNTSITSPGYLSPWKQCAISSVITPDAATTPDFNCRGRLDDFSTIPAPSLRIATVVAALATLIATLSVFGLVLFLCAPTSVAYHIVSWMQLMAALCTSLSLLVFPIGWDSTGVRLICGPGAGRFNLGNCEFRWVFILAVLGLLDGIVLAALGFILGSKHVKLSPLSKGRTSSSYMAASGHYPMTADTTLTGPPSHPEKSRSLLNLQPIILLPPELDAYSTEYGRSNKTSLYKAEYATPSQHFQL